MIFVFLIIGLLVLLFSTYLHPTIRASIFSNKNQKTIAEFISQVQKSKTIDPMEYWQLREFTSRGSFSINPNFVKLFQTYQIVSINPSEKTELLYYTSPYILSTESVVDQKFTLVEIAQDYQSSEILLKTNQILLVQNQLEASEKHKSYELWFLLPIEEMRQTVGFFNYTSDELSLLENSNWLHHSLIKLN